MPAGPSSRPPVKPSHQSTSNVLRRARIPTTVLSTRQGFPRPRGQRPIDRAKAKASRTMLRLCITFSLAAAAMAQVPFLGTCPDMETMPDFDAERYMGKWYEAERYFAFFEFGGKCVIANYSLNKNGSVRILNKQISALTGVASSIEGIGRLIGRNDDPKFTVAFPSIPFPLDAPYWILRTDYDNYAVVWSCFNFGIFSVRNVWILTRQAKPPMEIMEKAYKTIDKNNISRAYFIRTDQKNCPASY